MSKKDAMALDWNSEFGRTLSKRERLIREKLKEERKAHKVSLREMAAKICIDATTLSMHERGLKKYLPFQMVVGYSHVLEVPLGQLIFPESTKKAINDKLEKEIRMGLSGEDQKLLADLIGRFISTTVKNTRKQ